MKLFRWVIPAFVMSFILSGCSSAPNPLAIPPGPYEHSYRSTSAQRELPFLAQYPDGEVKGILIYEHGAGGGMEQGMQDDIYKNNFKNLKDLLKKMSYLYVTPATIDFDSRGGQDLVDLAKELQIKYPNVPIYLAGASAGGRTMTYALEKDASRFAGAVLLCPAIAPDETQNGIAGTIPLYVMQGIQDPMVSVDAVDAFVSKVKAQNHPVEYNRVDGDHNTPVQDVDWAKVLNTLR
jgi:predicted peptidase